MFSVKNPRMKGRDSRTQNRAGRSKSKKLGRTVGFKGGREDVPDGQRAYVGSKVEGGLSQSVHPFPELRFP